MHTVCTSSFLFSRNERGQFAAGFRILYLAGFHRGKARQVGIFVSDQLAVDEPQWNAQSSQGLLNFLSITVL